MRFENVGYNGPFLAELTEAKFQHEVKHHFTRDEQGKEKMKELYRLIQAKYGKPKTKSQNAQAPTGG